jgi:hypothetical protein
VSFLFYVLKGAMCQFSDLEFVVRLMLEFLLDVEKTVIVCVQLYAAGRKYAFSSGNHSCQLPISQQKYHRDAQRTRARPLKLVDTIGVEVVSGRSKDSQQPKRKSA